MNLIEIPIFTSSYINELAIQLKNTENTDAYKESTFLYEKRFAKGRSFIFMDKNFQLDPNLSDCENSIRLYTNLKSLNETQASDERLWTYLTHVRFWEYMKSRWPIDNIESPHSRIWDRYFMRALSLNAITRNGIARLWWVAHLTYEKNRTDHFELTRLIWDKQDFMVQIMERELGCNRNIRTALLEFLRDNSDINKEAPKRSLMKELNLIGGVKSLPYLSVEEIKQLLLKVKPIALKATA